MMEDERYIFPKKGEKITPYVRLKIPDKNELTQLCQ
jgi:hypothetical protein